ncbi:hypothetical protein ACSC89_004758 [Salmonella enterica subsp. enterica]
MCSFTLRSSERWVLHGDVSPEALDKFAYIGRKLSWEQSDISQKESIDFIELMPTSSDIKHIPLIIRELPNLRKIIIPTWFVPELHHRELPESVNTIIVGLLNETSKKNISWNAGEVFNNIIELHGVGENVVFSSSNFPNLNRLHIRIGKKESEYTEIRKLPKLSDLIIEKPTTVRALNELSDLNVKYLQLSRGKFDSFDGLLNLQSLLKLELQFCDVSDLSGLKILSSVTEIEMWNCKKIIDIKPLADIESVKRIYIIGCSVNMDDNNLCDYFKVRGFTKIRYEPNRSDTLFEAIR